MSDKKAQRQAAREGQKIQPGAVNVEAGTDRDVQTSHGPGVLRNEDGRILDMRVRGENVEFSLPGSRTVRVKFDSITKENWEDVPRQGGEGSGRLPGETNVVVNEGE